MIKNRLGDASLHPRCDDVQTNMCYLSEVEMDIKKEDIEKVLDEKVRPGLALHGGDIAIERFEAGVLYVRLLGNCVGCMSADTTMTELVESELRSAFPELKEVSLITGVSDDLIAQARDILNRIHSGK